MYWHSMPYSFKLKLAPVFLGFGVFINIYYESDISENKPEVAKVAPLVCY